MENLSVKNLIPIGKLVKTAMTANNILHRVELEANSRFGDVIDILLSILDRKSKIPNHTEERISQYVKKWLMTGLLDKVPDDLKSGAAISLEEGVWDLIRRQSDGENISETYIVECLVEKMTPFIQ